MLPVHGLHLPHNIPVGPSQVGSSILRFLGESVYSYRICTVQVSLPLSSTVKENLTVYVKPLLSVHSV